MGTFIKTPDSPKALFHTFGCKLNFAETASVAGIFEANGIGEWQKDCGTPDFIVVNSCSVTAEADRKCRSAIRAFNRRFPDAAILVTGCYAQLKADEIYDLPGVIGVVGINDKLKLAGIALDWLKGIEMQQRDIVPAKELREFMPSCSKGNRTRYFLKVQDGCDYWCTYCTIPKARGRSRSGSIEQLVAQAEEVARQGGREIVITGVNIGDFGAGRRDRFIDLCRALDKVEGIQRYRISSIEPNLLTDELIEFTAASRAFMPHFHIPLQSGSDVVLKLMRRRYDTELFRNKIERVKSVIPDAFIGIDLIVGARGETQDEFERSKDFVNSLDISHVHVFPYSERPGTKALEIDGVVSQQEKHRRSSVMGEISMDKHRRFAEQFVNTVRPVLLEHGAGNGLAGFTDNYIRVETDAPASMDNAIVDCCLELNTQGDGTVLKAHLNLIS